MSNPSAYPDNPVMTRVVRGSHVESQHRGAWVLVDSAGNVLAGAGNWQHPIFARSATKSMQALPLLESGAAERFGMSPEEIALALSSHNAETCHTERVRAFLDRMGLSVADLRCGPQPPGDSEARAELAARGEQPSALHNNCSGKHAGFLALALHLGEDPARYLARDSAVQAQVERAVREISGAPDAAFDVAIDGCSAPTFRLPLANLATGLARIANPEGLAPARRAACERMLAAVAAHPALIAGQHGRICTALARASAGRIFPKVGSDGVYVLGVRGADRGLAIKVDDGAFRGFYALLIELLRRFGFLGEPELAELASWRDDPLLDWAGQPVGRVEVVL